MTDIMQAMAESASFCREAADICPAVTAGVARRETAVTVPTGEGGSSGGPVGNESRFRRLVDSGIIGVFEGNDGGQILSGNEAFLQMLGYNKEDLSAGTVRWDQMIVPGYDHVKRHFQEQLASTGNAAPVELEYYRKDGSKLPAVVGLASVGRGPSRAIGFMLDLTPQKRAQDALKKSEEQFRQLAENIREVFWMMNAEGTEVLYVSPAYEHIWGSSCQSACENAGAWMESIYPEDRAHAAELFDRQVRGELIESEYRIVQPSGGVRWIRDRAFPVRNESADIVRLAGVAEDITERKLSELRLVHHSYYDDLTDLPNRRLFREKLKTGIDECPRGKSGAVFFIDLDQFKLVNDTLGHTAGDELLKKVACRMLSVCGDAGTLARFGGDEFMLLATGFDGSEPVRLLGQQLIDCLNQPFRIADREVFVGASVGVSVFPKDGTDPFALKTAADAAMHESKRAGRNQLRFFDPGLENAARERLESETRLRRALAQSEFVLQFQPQFASGGSRPRRFEALIRWHPRDGEAVPPDRFIPIAEQNGLIVPIGTWVLREACRRCADWQKGDLAGVGVAVNVSALQFACADFVEIVMKTLDATNLPAHLLELELTESVFVRDMNGAARTLETLRSLGVTIALDDFGTGYSSLGYLKNLPLNALKIDRFFMIDAEGRRQGADILRCVVALAHAHGLRVVGEGVETAAQLKLLTGLECDEIQGFFLGRPSDEVEVDDQTRSRNFHNLPGRHSSAVRDWQMPCQARQYSSHG